MSSQVICGPLPIVAAFGAFFHPGPNAKDKPSAQYYISQDPKAWLSHSNIFYSFLEPDGDEKFDDWQVQLVENAIAEYTRYANVNLTRMPVEAGQDKSAEIRISFDGSRGAWSAIGIDALKISEGPTMNLGFLSGFKKEGPTDSKERERLYNFTLHQFGHAFGLAHEWKNGPELRQDENGVISQHIGAVGSNDTSNFPGVDEDSIMMFFVPEEYSNKGEIKLKGGLSQKDKAWLTLIYPGKAGGADADTGILQCLKDLQVPLEPSSQILLAATVSEMRFHYHKCISDKWHDRLNTYYVNGAIKSISQRQLDNLLPESDVLKGKVSGITPLVDHNSEDDLYDAVAAAVLDPQFSQVLANVVNQDDDGEPGVQNDIWRSNLGTPGFMPWKIRSSLLQGSIASGINPQAPPDVQNFLGPLINAVGGLLGQLLLSGLPANAAPGMYQQALPPNVEQGIFNTLAKFLKHPTFLGIVRDVADDMLKQHGLIKSDQNRGTERKPLQ